MDEHQAILDKMLALMRDEIVLRGPQVLNSAPVLGLELCVSMWLSLFSTVMAAEHLDERRKRLIIGNARVILLQAIGRGIEVIDSDDPFTTSNQVGHAETRGKVPFLDESKPSN